jgi:hypothetical protein
MATPTAFKGGRGIELSDGTSLAVSPTSKARIRYNSTLARFEQSVNGAAYVALAAGSNAELFIAQSSAAALGAASTNSTSFADVGNGSSTGFSSWTVSAPVTKTYMLTADLSLYASVLGFFYTFRVVVGSTNYEAAHMNGSFVAINAAHSKAFSVPVALVAGNNTIKLQWKTDGGLTAAVDTNSYRSFSLIG